MPYYLLTEIWGGKQGLSYRLVPRLEPGNEKTAREAEPLDWHSQAGAWEREKTRKPLARQSLSTGIPRLEPGNEKKSAVTAREAEPLDWHSQAGAWEREKREKREKTRKTRERGKICKYANIEIKFKSKLC